MARDFGYAQKRQAAVQDLNRARESGEVVGFEVRVDVDCCDRCPARKRAFVPLAGCRTDELPPYRRSDCDHKTGCEAFALEVTTADILPRRPAPRPRRGRFRLSRLIWLLAAIALAATLLRRR